MTVECQVADPDDIFVRVAPVGCVVDCRVQRIDIGVRDHDIVDERVVAGLRIADLAPPGSDVQIVVIVVIGGVVTHGDTVAPDDLNTFAAVAVDKVVFHKRRKVIAGKSAGLGALKVIDDDAVAIGVIPRTGHVVIRDVVADDRAEFIR